MSLISPKFAAELNEKEMRDAYLSAQTRTYLSYQIRTIRSQRGWSQEEFAKKLNTSQSAVSRMEDRQYGKQNLQTLVQVANVFDCGLLVQFVPYDEFILKTDDMSQEALGVPEFDSTALLPLAEDLPTIEIDPPDYLRAYVGYNDAHLQPGTSLLILGGLLQSGSQWPSLFTDALQPSINEPYYVLQAGQTNTVSANELEAENARLKAENARLKAEKERLSSAPTALFVVKQRPSQLPGF